MGEEMVTYAVFVAALENKYTKENIGSDEIPHKIKQATEDVKKTKFVELDDQQNIIGVQVKELYLRDVKAEDVLLAQDKVLREELAKKNEKLRTAYENVEKSQVYLDNFVKVCEQKNHEIAKLKEQLRDWQKLGTNCDEVQNKLEKAIKERDQAIKDRDQAEEELQQQKTTVSNLEEGIERLQNQIRNLENERDAFRKKAADTFKESYDVLRESEKLNENAASIDFSKYVNILNEDQETTENKSSQN